VRIGSYHEFAIRKIAAEQRACLPLFPTREGHIPSVEGRARAMGVRARADVRRSSSVPSTTAAPSAIPLGRQPIAASIDRGGGTRMLGASSYRSEDLPQQRALASSRRTSPTKTPAKNANGNALRQQPNTYVRSQALDPATVLQSHNDSKPYSPFIHSWLIDFDVFFERNRR